ncbi:EF-Tu C-terminal domain-related protein, partial [Staphylococcus epidermidis]
PPHAPFFANYPPQFYFPTTHLTPLLNLPQPTQILIPPHNLQITLQLIPPIPIQHPTPFSIPQPRPTLPSPLVTEIFQ